MNKMYAKIGVLAVFGGTAIALPIASASAHTVKPGETTSSVARDHKTSVKTLSTLNNLRDPNKIKAGQHLKTPKKTHKPRPAPKPEKRVVNTVEQNVGGVHLSKAEAEARAKLRFRESSGNYDAVNPSSGAYGAFQVLPGIHPDAPKHGAPKATQDRWAQKYVEGRYGSWQNALKFHYKMNWY